MIRSKEKAKDSLLFTYFFVTLQHIIKENNSLYEYEIDKENN